MDAVFRALAIYFFLLILTRLSGRRTLSEMTTFDFVLLLILSEATQNALLGEDFSVINAFIVIATLIGMDIALSVLKDRSKLLERLLDGVPTVLMKSGHLFHDRLKKSRISEEDILQAARESHGIGSLKEIEHAVLEPSGKISAIPYHSEETAPSQKAQPSLI